MLLVAALLLAAVGVIHSVLGEKKLIAPIIALENLPHLRGSRAASQRTLRAGWHILSVTWWGMAVIFASMHLSPERAELSVLVVSSVLFGVLGIFSLVASRGKHPSWCFFIPISILTGMSGLQLY